MMVQYVPPALSMHGRRQGLSSVPGVVVLDTCVLVSTALRTLLLQLASDGWFKPVWSAVIGDEWRRTTARLWNIDQTDITKQWEALQHDFPQADMGDVSSLKQGLALSDPKDWHVVAAARAAALCHPDLQVAIVTRNIKDFHRAELRRLGLYLLDPDRLLSQMWTHDARLLWSRLQSLPTLACIPDREPDTLDGILKRERLFRLNRLCKDA